MGCGGFERWDALSIGTRRTNREKGRRLRPEQVARQVKVGRGFGSALGRAARGRARWWRRGGFARRLHSCDAFTPHTNRRDRQLGPRRERVVLVGARGEANTINGTALQ